MKRSGVKRQHSGRIERRPAQEHIAALRWAWGRAYEAACKDDGIAPDAQEYEGKTIAVTGEITLYRGRPQIIVERAWQVQEK